MTNASTGTTSETMIRVIMAVRVIPSRFTTVSATTAATPAAFSKPGAA